MFLEKLSEYAGQIALPPPMYQSTSIRYVIRLDADGDYINTEELVTEKNKPPFSRNAPSCKRSSGVKPKLLVDNGEYTLGIGREKSDPRRVQEQHTAYVTQVCECAVATGESSVRAVEHFLRSPDVERITREKPDFDPSANITFRVKDCYPFDLESVKRYWAKKAAAADNAGPMMQCLVCGEMRPPVERLPIYIKGIPGGQSTGLTLISANAAAFESYGLIASLTAPTCEVCGERFGNALNALLRGEKTHIVIPPLAYVFWLRDPGAADLNMQNLMNAEPADVQNLFQAAWRGKAESTLIDDASVFYAATLSASGARVVLRDWIETPVDSALQNLVRYFTLQQIKDKDYQGQLRRFSLYSLINATINRDTQEKPQAQVGQTLMHVALHGGQLPMSILYKVVLRIRASRKVMPAQASLIKMVLLSQRDTPALNKEGDDYMTTLSEDEENVAYLCGRLLALLEHIQHRALRNVNATIVDRFYGTASVSPAVVFPRLLKGAMPHLSTIRQNRSKPGTGYLGYLDKELGRLLGSFPRPAHSAHDIPPFPRTLTLEQQGWFALGFHQQRESHFSRQENKPQDTNSDSDTTETEEEQ